MTLAKKKSLGITEGPLLVKIILFVLPLMAANLLQVFYNAADMIIVSLSAEGDAVGAIGITSSLVNLVVNIFSGFAVGANVVIARHLGAGDEEETSRTVHTSVLMSLLFGGISAAVGCLLCGPVLSLMGAEGRLHMLAVRYTAIYFLGAPFVALTNYAIAIYRAKGDTKTPLAVLGGAGALNVLLNLFFVLVCGLSVEGVSLATVISNAVSAVILLWRLTGDSGACRFSLKRLRIDRCAFRQILSVGLPAGIQGVLFSLSNLIIQSSILQVNNALSPSDSAFQPVVKGNAATANLEAFVYTATNSVYQASITFTGQNAGAGKYGRVRRAMLCCYTLTTAIAIAFGFGMYFLRTPLLSLYGVVPGAPGSLEQIAFETAEIRMKLMFLTYASLAWMEVGSGVLRGLGRSLTSTVITMVGACLFRIAWIGTVFRAMPTLEIIYLSYPISWVLTTAAFLPCAFIIIKKERAKLRACEITE